MSRLRSVFGVLFALALVSVMVLPASAQMMTPAVTVSDQAIVNGQVTVDKVVSDGPGWIVIHAQADGKPGPILGYSQVSDGENDNVAVQIDATQATPVLYAMLHTDAGIIGTFEFPNGADTPVSVDGQVVTPAFNVTVGVGVADQEIIDGTVTVARVFSQGPGWIVIHAQADGKPGPILGYSPVVNGENKDVVVRIDQSQVTDTLYAMLHVDAGIVGTFEFPNGADVPVKVGDTIITPSFSVMGAMPQSLPQTGAAPAASTTVPWAILLLATLGVIALAGGYLLAPVRIKNDDSDRS